MTRAESTWRRLVASVVMQRSLFIDPQDWIDDSAEPAIDFLNDTPVQIEQKLIRRAAFIPHHNHKE